MLTKINTYEGVPIGNKNFDEFFNYVREFLSANFNFSTYLNEQGGGFFPRNENPPYFSYVQKGAYNFFMPTIEQDDLYGSDGNEFFKFTKYGPTTENPEVLTWELLPTLGSFVDGFYEFSNDSITQKVLPYNPVNLSETSTDGYNFVSFNGVYQEPVKNYGFSISTPSGENAFRKQSLRLFNIQLGAESPVPIDSSKRFKSGLGYSAFPFVPSTGISFNEFSSLFNQELVFENTNFSIGGHILLTRETSIVGVTEKAYQYVPRDETSGTSVKLGHYKVIDSANGKIKLNISFSQLDSLITTSERASSLSEFSSEEGIYENLKFHVVSPEQLFFDPQENVTNYRSSYGPVYTGNENEVLVVEVFESNGVYQVNDDVESIATFPGDIILQDDTGVYDNSFILALSYPAEVNIEKYINNQKNNYHLDVFRLYYHAGNSGNPTISQSGVDVPNIFAFVEHNPSSWYNKRNSDGEYLPVNRTINSYLSFINLNERNSSEFSDVVVFDPNKAFTVSDALTLAELADVIPKNEEFFSGEDDGHTVVYDSSEQRFLSTPFTLGNLTNVASFESQSPSFNNQVLTYNNETQTWSPKRVVDALTYTPVNKGGDTIRPFSASDSGRLEYDEGNPMTLFDNELDVGVDSNQTLTSKEYVLEAVSQNITTLNRFVSESQQSDIGFVLKRFTDQDLPGNSNVAFYWNEVNDSFTFGTTTESLVQNDSIELDSLWLSITDSGTFVENNLSVTGTIDQDGIPVLTQNDVGDSLPSLQNGFVNQSTYLSNSFVTNPNFWVVPGNLEGSSQPEGVISYVPIELHEPVNISKFAVEVLSVDSGESSVDFALYSSNSSGLPDQRTIFGSIDGINTVGVHDYEFSPSLTIDAGLYWLATLITTTSGTVDYRGTKVENPFVLPRENPFDSDYVLSSAPNQTSLPTDAVYSFSENNISSSIAMSIQVA